MSDYLTLNARETEALVRAIDAPPDVVRSVQLSRRDSLDNPYADGFLVVSVVTTDDQYRVAISETGATTNWGDDWRADDWRAIVDTTC